MSNSPTRSTPRQVGTALLQDLSDKLAVRAQRAFGVSEAKARAFAIDAAVSVADDWGGQLIYVPMDAAGRLSQRNETIWREFRGDNHAELATKYGLSVMHIYRILDEQRELRTPRQLSLLTDDRV